MKPETGAPLSDSGSIGEAALWYTRCPFCEAVFRVREAKLRVRQGEVRCGACREVFNATRHFVIQGDDGRFLPDDRDIAGIFTRESFDESSTGNLGAIDDSSAVDSSLPDPVDRRAEREQAERERAERERAEREQAEREQAEREQADISTPSNVDKSFVQPTQPGETGDSVEGPRETEATAFMDRNSQAGDDHHAPVADLGITPEHSPGNWFNTETDSRLERNPFRHQHDPGANGAREIDRPGAINMNGVDAYIVDRPNPLAAILWFLVAVFFVFLLGLQVRTYFVDRYAQDENYRPYLALFCKLAACELPMRRDTYRFALTHTRIDLHPEEPGALRITVKLVNQAAFAQPFPDLQLTLTDRVGRVVGRRTYDPRLYLSEREENLLGSGELGTVEFDLAHPHEKAVGFVVDIVREPAA
jgi:predicted Zn finger-like uncharacterized protein